MFCKWCGLESDTTDVCSWCRRPFTTATKQAPQPQQAASPVEAVVAPPVSAPPAREAPPERADLRAARPEVVPPVAASPPAPSPAAPEPFADELLDDFSPSPFATPVPGAAVPAERMPSVAPQPPTAREHRAAPARPEPAVGVPGPSETIPIRKPAAPLEVIPVARLQPTPPPTDAPHAAERAAPPAAHPATVRDQGSLGDALPLHPQPTAPPPVARDAPQVDLPELDLAPLGDAVEEVVAPSGNRLDIAGLPTVDLPIRRGGPPPGPLPAFARPVQPSTVTVPKAGGRTWYCRWCGMESETGDRCSWCRKDLRNLPAAGSGKGPVLSAGKRAVVRAPAPVRRGRDGNSSKPATTERPLPPRRAEVAPKPVPQPVPAPAAATAGSDRAATARQGVPVMGTFQAQKSKYYADQVVDPISGKHYDADTGETTDTPVQMAEDVLQNDRAEQLKHTGVYAGALAMAIMLCAALAHWIPDWYLALIAALNVAAGMAMPPLGVVDYGEDDSSDVALAISLILILGPIVGGMAYGVIAIMRMDANPAIVGIFISYLLIRFPLQLAAGTGIGESLQSLVPFAPPPDGNWGTHLALQWLPFATMAGWYMAAVFHKPDE